MDTEQFGQILQMVGQAGEGAFALAIVYLATGFVKGFIIPSAFIVFVVLAGRMVRYGVDKNCAFELKKVRAERLVDLNYYRLHYPHTSRGEAEAALNAPLNKSEQTA